MPKLSEAKKSAISVLRSEVEYELKHRRQLQAQPALAHIALSVTRTPGLLGEGQERDGYETDPGSHSSQVLSPTPPCPFEEQSISVLLSRMEIFETRVQKVEHLESRCAQLEATVEILKHENSELRESFSTLKQENAELRESFSTLEQENAELRESFSLLELENTEVRESCSNHNVALVELKDSLTQLESTGMSQQTAAPRTSRDLENRISHMERAFPMDLIELNDKIEELKSQLDNFEARSSSEPLTRWQQWKKEACRIIGTSNPNAKSQSAFQCHDANCTWKNKRVTLNAYIQHMKRNHEIILNSNPHSSYLPTV